MDTVCAVSTPRGKGGISVIRVSGKDAIDITASIFRSKKDIRNAATHTVTFGVCENNGHEIDQCLVTVFREPESFTGENVCEISCHGSVISVERIIDALIENGASPAGRGEFTKRAFMNGKMSLTQAEAVNDIINAKTDGALWAAVNRIEGGIAKPIIEIREELLELLAAIQVSTDFPEDDIDAFAGGELSEKLENIKSKLEKLKSTARRGEALNNGIICAICGIPNTGKSSLLNALLEKRKAIVTDTAGTTRDVVEEWIDIEGIPVKIGDTAGIRESSDNIESMGIEMSVEYIKNADICIFVTEAGRELTKEEEKIISEINVPYLKVGNKTDIHEEKRSDYIGISAKKSIGIEELKKKISALAGDEEPSGLIANERQFEAVVKALSAVKRAIKGIEDGFFSDLASIDIQEAVGHLGEAEGISVNQETVNKIFEKFCLGK